MIKQELIGKSEIQTNFSSRVQLIHTMVSIIRRLTYHRTSTKFHRQLLGWI